VNFEGEGKPYKYLHANGLTRATGFYYYWGYKKVGKMVDEKYQGKNAEYYENGNVKEIVVYKDGQPTDENFFFDIEGSELK
jgi:antitoxin component YwqK of YwqJK toxin-antitoxin module